jgi:hypothetical protein
MLILPPGFEHHVGVQIIRNSQNQQAAIVVMGECDKFIIKEERFFYLLETVNRT